MQDNLFFFEPYQTTLEHLCKTYQITRLYAFGSVLTDRFRAESDLDFLVEMPVLDPLEKGEFLWELWDNLESLFQRRVDLLTPESLKNPYLIKSIEQTKQLIYDRNSEKIFG